MNYKKKKNFSNYSNEYFDNLKNSGKVFINDLFFALIIAISIFLVFFVIPRFFYEVVKVKGDSMLSTIHDEDKVRILKTKKVNYGDIVVINSKGLEVNEGVDFIIKRVIGLEGDTIELKIDEDTQEYYIQRSRLVNGETIITDLKNEPYINEKMSSGVLSKKYEVGPGEVFVIGDNRNNTFKDVIAENRILGKGVQILAKTNTFKFIGIEFNWYTTKSIKNPYKAA